MSSKAVAKTSRRASPARKVPPPIERGNAVAHVYETLRSDIVGLRLAPGELIDDVALAGRLGLSRTPIRQALSRLEGDGLVVQSPNRGYQVTAVNLLDTPRFVEALSLLQRAVMRTAAMRRTPQDLQRIELAYDEFMAGMERGDPAELTLANRSFHAAIAQACHNAYLAESYVRLLDQGMRMLAIPFIHDPAHHDSASMHAHRLDADHREMVDALHAGDAERAETLGSQHAEVFRSWFIRYLEQNLLKDMASHDGVAARR